MCIKLALLFMCGPKLQKRLGPWGTTNGEYYLKTSSRELTKWPPERQSYHIMLNTTRSQKHKLLDWVNNIYEINTYKASFKNILAVNDAYLQKLLERY